MRINPKGVVATVSLDCNRNPVGVVIPIWVGDRQLGDDLVDHFAGDVGEAEVPAVVTVGELLVVDAEEVENGGMKIVHAYFVHGGFETNLVGRAVVGHRL